MGKSNEELIEKTISSSDLLSGGKLYPEQQAQFTVLIRKYSTLLPEVRFVEMDNPTEDIDKLHVGEPITESAEENADTGNLSKAKFNKVTMTTKKLRSAWNITTETLQGNIERADFEGRIFDSMAQRISTDMEMLAIQGDTTISGTDAVSRLLKRYDGWDKLSEGSHILDAGGVSIEKGIWAAARDALPKQFRNDPGLRWIVSDSLMTDWRDLLGDRATILGDSALGGSSVAPLGIPVIEVPLIPDDKALVVSGASAAEVVGLNLGPFAVELGVNDKFKIAVDGASAVVVTLPPGVLETVVVAKAINDAVGKVVASDNTFGALRLKSTTTGSSSSIDVQTQATNAYTTLGLTVATTSGATSGGTVKQGTFIWLCNPKNLIFGMLQATRVYSEYNKNFDRIETIVYNQTVPQIENLDAMVKVKNVRRRKLF